MDNQINHSTYEDDYNFVVYDVPYGVVNKKKVDKLSHNHIMFIKFILSDLTVSTTKIFMHIRYHVQF